MILLISSHFCKEHFRVGQNKLPDRTNEINTQNKKKTFDWRL